MMSELYCETCKKDMKLIKQTHDDDPSTWKCPKCKVEVTEW